MKTQAQEQFELVSTTLHAQLPYNVQKTIEEIRGALESYEEPNNDAPSLPPGAESLAVTYPSIQGVISVLEELNIKNIDEIIENMKSSNTEVETILDY